MGATLPGPLLAKPTGMFVNSKDAFDVAVATIEIHRDYGNRETKSKARFKWLIEDWGLKKFRKKLEQKIGKHLETYDGPIFTKNEGHYGIQAQKQKGYYFMNIPILGGVLSSEQMTSLAEIANEYGNGELRLTCTQNIILPNIQEKDLVLKRLDSIGFSLQCSKLQWTSMACASAFCGKTKSPHAKEVVKDSIEYLENNFTKKAIEEAKFRIYVSGCLNNCCANLLAEIGLRGKLSRGKEEKLEQKYDIMLLNECVEEPCLGMVIEKSVLAKDVKYKLKNLLVNYYKNRKSVEELSHFCKRHTKNELSKYFEE
jgi:sulfite reductase beta subunit-like hemoprotein